MTIDPACGGSTTVDLISASPPSLVLAAALGDSFHCGTAAGGFALQRRCQPAVVPTCSGARPDEATGARHRLDYQPEAALDR
jgi:hypothetical protein